MNIVIKNAHIINEGFQQKVDILVSNQIIQKIEQSIAVPANATVFDAEGLLVLPGIIDDQVHFREPGLTHKGNIYSESRAAAAGGITSFIEQPNTVPNATSIEVLEQKYQIALLNSTVNYSFMLGGTNTNLEEIKQVDAKNIAGIKLFLGSSTGNMLVDDDQAIENIFKSTPLPIAVHCEDEQTIKNQTAIYHAQYGDKIPFECHHLIRSEEACYLSSSKAVSIAKKTGAKLHVFHISTAKELSLFEANIPLKDKKITAEVCLHHLWFSEKDYLTKGSLIKWNPAIKTEADKEALWQGLHSNLLDCIATDHAPHTLAEKQQDYTQAPSGGPLVQHALVAMLQKHLDGKISLEKLVEKMCHNPAIIFQIEKRGYIKEGYFADMVFVDLKASWQVKKSNILYHCGWSPLEGETFKASVMHTMVNGEWVYYNQNLTNLKAGKRLSFNR